MLVEARVYFIQQLGKNYADSPISQWITSGQVVQSKAPLLGAFVRAFRRGCIWVNDNRGKDSLVQLLAGYSHVEPALIARITIPLASADIRPDRFPKLIEFMRANKLLTTNLNLASHVYEVRK